MRIGVSNLLWTRELDEPVATLLGSRGIDAIDLVPTRYVDEVADVSSEQLRAIGRFWRERGIEIVGMQSLLHGTHGLDIFGDRHTRQRTAAHLRAVLRFGAEVGARQMVFGSWRNRIRGELPAADALACAADFFGEVAQAAAGLGVCLTIEPISARYGNDFLVDHEEAAQLVEQVSHPAFRLTLDVGCIALAGEDAAAVARRHGHLVSHVQLAAYQLAPLSMADPVHARAGPALTAALPGRVACIEALKPPDMSAFDAIAQCLDVAQRHYGPSDDAPGATGPTAAPPPTDADPPA
jgi:sugar phosphate isomerase/epimerase